MSSGSVIRRGKSSWRLKFEVGRDPVTRARRTQYMTVRGTRAQAEKELRAILYKQDKGVSIDPSTMTVSAFLDEWIGDVAPRSVGAKALERYRGLIRYQIKPHLGTIQIQKLRPNDISQWVSALEQSGLSIRSIRHAHGVLRTALSHAAAIEIIERNVCKIILPPKLGRKEIEILNADQVSDTLHKLEGHPLYALAAFAIGTGARRGEIAALRWSDLDLDNATVRIERSIEQTKAGLQVKLPKTQAGKRTISLPAFVVAALRDHRRATLELRMALGLGTLPKDAPVVSTLDGDVLSPHLITNRWRRAIKNRKLAKVSFHALRHTHASALISGGLDVVAVSRRLGHASPAMTLSVYGHLFKTDDTAAAAAIDAVMTNPI